MTVAYQGKCRDSVLVSRVFLNARLNFVGGQVGEVGGAERRNSPYACACACETICFGDIRISRMFFQRTVVRPHPNHISVDTLRHDIEWL